MALTRIGNQAISLDAAEIPNLDASKIVSGTIDNNRLNQFLLYKGINEEDLERLCILVKKIAEMQKIAFGAAGAKIIHNCESEAGQVVFHTHFHIIPYFTENKTMPDSLNSKEKQAEAVRKLLV